MYAKIVLIIKYSANKVKDKLSAYQSRNGVRGKMRVMVREK